jgi:hypothetical protein
MGKPTQGGAMAPKLSPQQLNAMQRQAVLSQSVEMIQQIYSQQIASPAANPVVNIQPRNVGLIKKFIVEVTGTLSAVVNNLAISDFGASNLLSQIQFTDLNNNVRVNTAGWHLAILEAFKKRSPVAGAFAMDSVGTSKQDVDGAGSVYPIIVAPATIAAAANSTVRMVYEIPLAYSDDDLRGAVYANVVNATMNLQLKINPTPVVVNTVDSTFAVYTSDTALNAGTLLTNVTITVYQVYLDQLPIGNKGVVLPVLDLSTVYELKNTNFTALTVGQDFPIPYANFRDFLSTTAIFNNNGILARNAGTDINYWSLQSANFTNLWKIDPLLAAQFARQLIQTDLPKGAYYFSHRRKPISTTQYGNMNLILNPSVVGAATGYVQIGWEDFALVNTLTSAGSLAG